jgi:ketosteroid isomerase-like protein
MATTSEDLREILSGYFDAWNAGDKEKFRSYYDEDCDVHLYGRHPLAGIYIGKEAVLGYQKKMAETCTSWTLLEVEDLMASDKQVAAPLKMRFEREGREPLVITRLCIYVFRDGKIVEMRGYDPDPERVDAFFS